MAKVKKQKEFLQVEKVLGFGGGGNGGVWDKEAVRSVWQEKVIPLFNGKPRGKYVLTKESGKKLIETVAKKELSEVTPSMLGFNPLLSGSIFLTPPADSTLEVTDERSFNPLLSGSIFLTAGG